MLNRGKKGAKLSLMIYSSEGISLRKFIKWFANHVEFFHIFFHLSINKFTQVCVTPLTPSLVQNTLSFHPCKNIHTHTIILMRNSWSLVFTFMLANDENFTFKTLTFCLNSPLPLSHVRVRVTRLVTLSDC
jgi:hypothetical protein